MLGHAIGRGLLVADHVRTRTISSQANPIDRYSISARQDLKPNPSGSIDIQIQYEGLGRAGVELAPRPS
jgi:hypothetical protein